MMREVIARAMFASKAAFDDGMCYCDEELTDWNDDGHLSATVDGTVVFTELAQEVLDAISDAGFVIVPKEPTEAMIEGAEAIVDYYEEICPNANDLKRYYTAMIEASQESE